LGVGMSERMSESAPTVTLCPLPATFCVWGRG
jgi:hypothetical protein